MGIILISAVGCKSCAKGIEHAGHQLFLLESFNAANGPCSDAVEAVIG